MKYRFKVRGPEFLEYAAFYWNNGCSTATTAKRLECDEAIIYNSLELIKREGKKHEH